jgi:hypothetical protein
VIFADTPAPAGAVADLTEPTVAPARDTALMAWYGLGLTALYLGVASAARDWLIGFLTERTPTALGRPVGPGRHAGRAVTKILLDQSFLYDLA